MNGSIQEGDTTIKPIFKEQRLSVVQIIILFVLSLVLIIVDHRTTHLQRVRGYLNTIVSPLQFLVSAPIEGMDIINDAAVSHADLVTVNKNLRAQLLALNVQLQQLKILQYENQHLRALLGLAKRTSGKAIVAAAMLPVQAEPLQEELLINKGSAQGVTVGATVLDNFGVMGQVIAVSANSSRMMLLTDSRSSIPVTDARSGFEAILNGTGDRHVLSMDIAPDTQDKVQVGDTLLSSSMGHVFLPGRPVGVVTNITKGEPQWKVSVAPAAHMNSSQFVILIQQAIKPEIDSAADPHDADNSDDPDNADLKSTSDNSNSADNSDDSDSSDNADSNSTSDDGASHP